MSEKLWILIPIGFILLTGGCIADCAWSVPDFSEAQITNKHHVPGHYENQCYTENIQIGKDTYPVFKCHDVWIGPTWTLFYRDLEGEHPRRVTQAIYDSYGLGQKVFVRFYRGYYTNVRYSEEFETSLPAAEKF